MNKKYIEFLKKVSKIDGFIPIQFTFLSIFLYCLLGYIYSFFQKPSAEAYSRKFESYSGLLIIVHKRKGGGRAGGAGGIDKIVIEGDKGVMEFKLNVYSVYNQPQDLDYFSGKKIFKLTHYNNYIVSCTDDKGGACIQQCSTPVECENLVIKKNREEYFIGLLISLLMFVIFFFAASIHALKEGKNNV